MLKFFSKKWFAVVFLGGVLFLSQIGTVSAADAQYVFQYNNTAGSPRAQTYGPFPDMASCSVAQQQFSSDTANYKMVSSCIAQSNEFFQNATLGTVPGFNNVSCFTSSFPYVSPSGCIAYAAYGIIYVPSSWLLIISGYLFDATLALSIDTNFVNQPFVEDTWVVVRDFSNMLFIFILLYTGILTILGMGNWRETVIKVVIMALLINFSLFFTKVVIDAGNVLAVGVYEAIGVVKTDGVRKSGSGATTLQERNLSEALVANFAPQKFLAKAGTLDGFNAVVVFIVAAIVNGFAAYVFFMAALLFIGRLIAFWFLMIASPFAFISIALPKGNVFSDWADTLIKQTFVAPLFLFLFYILIKVLSASGGILQHFVG